MEWLNYHHLLYFWTVAQEGSIARACRVLHLSQPTVSAQIKALEDTLGEQLFIRKGRALILTDTGQVAFRYADNIFSLGREMLDVLKGRAVDRPLELRVGITDVVPKLIAYHLIEPALNLGTPIRITCREGSSDRLLADLAANDLNLVISDAQVPPTIKIRAFNHLLGECGITFVASHEVAHEYRKDFPKCLTGAPLLVPTEATSLRRSLDAWFDSHSLVPRIAGEFDDAALMHLFAKRGLGICPVASAIADEVLREYRLEEVGTPATVTERYFAISVERKLKHPAVLAISQSARAKFFSAAGPRVKRRG